MQTNIMRSKIPLIQKFLDIKHAVWCMDIPSDFFIPAFKGTFTFYPEFGDIDYELTDPSYADIFRMIDNYIEQSKDYDHHFIEDIYIKGDTLEVFLGS
jgi:hypothetical protein